MHPSLRHLGLCGSLALGLSGAYAQTGSLKFDHISLEHGLSQSTVNAIVQDGQGFLWFGTQDGLNRYDGYTITVFKHSASDSSSISDNGVWSICRDVSGDIWIGTMRGGLNRYSLTRGSFTYFAHDPADPRSISENNVTAVFQDSRGSIWAGTLTNGLNRFDAATNSFLHFRHDPADTSSLADNAVWSICEDRQGTIWIATWGGLCRFVPPDSGKDRIAPSRAGSFVRYRHDPRSRASLAGNNIRSLLADRAGILWIGTWGNGLDRFEPSTGRMNHYVSGGSDPAMLSSNLILSLHEDRDGRLWIGTGDAGLNVLDPATGIVRMHNHQPNTPGTLNNDIVCSLYENTTGILWIGTGAGGVNVYDRLKNRFPHFRDNQNDPNDLNGNDVWALLEDRNGRLWIGTYGDGLNRYDRKSESFEHFRHDPRNPKTLSHDHVLSLCQSRDGGLWVGTEGGGLNRLDERTGTFTHYRHDPRNSNSISQDEITVLHEDRDGFLWIGTNGTGLDRLSPDRQTFTHFPPSEKDTLALPSGSVLAIAEDRAGHLWIGTYGGGLVRYEPGCKTFIRFSVLPDRGGKLNNATVLAILEDPSGVLWVGTYGGGLNRYDPHDQTWRHITEAEGLPNDVIYGILPDNAGRLWLPTNKGLACFSPSTGHVRSYDIHDGLQGNEFNQGAYHRSPTGQLYLGGINGFNAFFPDSVRDNPFVPPVYLTSFRIFDDPVPLAQSITTTSSLELPHDRNFFSFEFVALNYTSPAKNRYAYILDGLDQRWIEAGTRRYVSYTNLDPGRYTLRIRGSNNDGLWNERGIALAITIIPPYWKTWWFRILAVGTVAALLFVMYRYRVNKLLEIERIRTSIATDLHDDIGSTLTEIALFSDVGLRELRARKGAASLSTEERNKLSGLLGEIGTTSRTLIDAMNDIVWSIDPKNDSFEFLLLRMKSHATKILEAKGINYEIDIPPELAHLRLPLGFRRRFFLIFKESINNVIRHAHPSRVVLTMRREGRSLSMTIADNGVGFDPRDSGHGNGLHNMEQRARSLGGELAITSAPGLGTTITLHTLIP